jgi:hypothetical protein
LKQLWEPGRGEIVTQALMGEARAASTVKVKDSTSWRRLRDTSFQTIVD